MLAKYERVKKAAVAECKAMLDAHVAECHAPKAKPAKVEKKAVKDDK